ncbi:oxidative damage protection protein [Pantoea sp. Mhis]|uniref:oxidative damage protection protein n=1 Tax=Pantoea sp. Mhis TaxID=2576759 RepID=UPI001356A23C|nr:oxidative damage protection protein [Pantoea sp. Mhis]MXP56694.1 oxidative damage protection protein [Pantoea sp. Mhis]
MKRIIFCTYLQQSAEGQNIQIYPGELGKRIYNEISQEAWNQWLIKQTMLINENKLNMIKEKDRNFLKKNMIYFFFKEKIA